MKIFSVIITLVFVYFLTIKARAIFKSIRAKKWKKTNGRIISQDIEEEYDCGYETVRIIELKYSYEVECKKYISQRIGFDFPKYSGPAYVKTTLTKVLDKSPMLNVYYDPDSPEISVLTTGFKSYHLSSVISYIAVLLVLCMALAKIWLINSEVL